MKRKLTLLPVLLTLSLIFSGCQKSPETTLTTQIDNSFSPTVTITRTDQSLNAGSTVENNTLTPIVSQQTETIQITSEPLDFIFSEQGPYKVGVKDEISYQDPSRNNRKISITIWYPAVLDTESPDNKPVHDAQADLSGAPYPLILSSTKVGFRFRNILPSYGFVYIGIDDIDTYEHFDHNIIDQPLDILFVLEQVSSTPIDGLEGMINANNSGVMGYSFDGLNALILSGARIDPQYYLTYCDAAPSSTPPLENWYLEYYCNLSKNWDELLLHAGPEITSSHDGLWQPIMDERIRAVMPMATDGAWLFGEKGLAEVSLPILMIQTRYDTQYQIEEAKFIFEHLGTTDKHMITFIEKGHMMIYDSDSIAKMAHFAVAFFGYHLQDHEEYAQYFSKEFVDQYEDLFFGFYEE